MEFCLLEFLWCKGVKYKYVRKRPLPSWAQETISSYRYMSTLALFFLFAEPPDKVSSESSWRVSSTAILEHTSVKKEAVTFLISLCRKVGEPPLLQERVCLTKKGLLHTHFTGTSLFNQPYRMVRTSQRTKPCSRIGREFTQEEAPSCCTNSRAWFRSLGTSGRRKSAMDLK